MNWLSAHPWDSLLNSIHSFSPQLSLPVPESDPIRDIRVDVDIKHSWPGDLLVRLLPPAPLGVDPLTLHDGEGERIPNIRRVFDRVTTPPLAALEGLDPGGTWTLEVTDRMPRDQGRIVHFGLEFAV